MSTIIDCDEGFVTSIGCDLSVADIKVTFNCKNFP